ncbi:MAG: GAF domain-containing protein [Deltaproteobacteria bacterium]
MPRLIKSAPKSSSRKKSTAAAPADSDVKAEKTLRDLLPENHELFRAILGSSGEGLLVVDNKGKVIHANRQFARMWSVSDEALKSGSNKMILVNVLNQLRDPNQFLDRVRYLYSTDKDGFDTLFFKDGRIFERYTRPLVQEGEIVGRVWSFRDVTDRKKAEAALEESERKYRALFDSIDEGFCIIQMIFDENGKPVDYRFLETNSAFEKQTGLVDANGKTVREMLPRNEDYWFEIYGRIALTGKPSRFQNRAEQLLRWFDVYAFRVGQPQNRWVAALFRDITGQKLDEKKILYQTSILEGISRIFREALTCETEKELARTCLDVAENVTGSKFGFIGEIGQDGFVYDICTSDPGWQACRMKDQSGHRIAPGTFENHGLYGKVLQSGAFFTNAPAAHPASIGTPDGHPALTSFLGVPLVNGGKTMGLIALANRDSGYRQEEVQALEVISSAVVQALLRKRAEKQLVEYQKRLEARVVERTTELVETNTALKVLLQKRENDRRQITEQLVSNVKQVIEPIVEKLANSGLTGRQADYLDILAANLQDIVAPLVPAASLSTLQLTPTEIQVASLIKQGKATKEIAELLHLSDFTIKAHRRAIRKKLGLAGQKVNLQSFLTLRKPSIE